ncbi:MAG: hypothetical protein IJ011_00325 [Clostridia bacterium]|nr:hypothetical protein [Clostridia bacterium]
MNENEFAVKVIFNGVEYPFAFGSEAYIFHTGVYNGIHKKYGIDGLMRYVTAVHECYIADSRKTPLRDLGDYMARHWASVEERARREILDDFYELYDNGGENGTFR